MVAGDMGYDGLTFGERDAVDAERLATRALIDGYRDACEFDPELPGLLRAFPEEGL